MALYIAPETIGKSLFYWGKIGLLTIAIIGFILINRYKIKISLPNQKELLVGVISGILIFIIILGVYQIFGQNWLDITAFRIKATELGISILSTYIFGAIYGVFLNPLIEEFIWRWFVYLKCKQLTSEIIAIFLSAFLFTLHHIIILNTFASDIRLVILGSLGVFLGGVIWGFCYRNFKSLWCSYISHLFADLALVIIGWKILFS
jgi:hypothetical protein